MVTRAVMHPLVDVLMSSHYSDVSKTVRRGVILIS